METILIAHWNEGTSECGYGLNPFYIMETILILNKMLLAFDMILKS